MLTKRCLSLSEFEYVYTQYVANMRKWEITGQVSSVNFASMITMKLFIIQRRILVSSGQFSFFFKFPCIEKIYARFFMHCINHHGDNHATNVMLIPVLYSTTFILSKLCLAWHNTLNVTRHSMFVLHFHGLFSSWLDVWYQKYSINSFIHLTLNVIFIRELSMLRKWESCLHFQIHVQFRYCFDCHRKML